MRYRKLGASDLSVSEISLGSWLTYGHGVDEERALACLKAAFDAGINFIDTANVYSGGAAETFLGRALKGRPRSSYILATKLYFPTSETDKGLSRAQILKQIDLSLKRLGTDHVDLYQCHRYDEDVPIEETMGALSEVVRAGKARWLGFSEWSPAQIESARKVPGAARFVSSQPQYSLLRRDPEEKVFPLCAGQGVGQIVWSPLAQGVLSGKYKPGASIPADSRAASRKMGGAIFQLLRHDVLEKAARLRPVAEQAGLTMSQLALAWVLRRPEVASAIVGASRPEQVAENAAASGKILSARTLGAIDAALA